MDIGKKIYELRKQNGMTREQLAKAVGVSTPAVSKWETGTSMPDILLLAPIARNGADPFQSGLRQTGCDGFGSQPVYGAKTL